MLVALAQPLEVEQVGGSFLDTFAGPALLAVAAIIAAGLAAWVARRNHAEQLAHDRDLRDLDHARQSVSAAVDTIAAAVPTVTHYAGSAWAASKAREAQAEAMAETDEAIPAIERGDDNELVDPREPEELEALGAGHLNWETEVMQVERDAIRAHNNKLEEAFENRPDADAVLSRLLADTLRLRIAIGEESAVVERHRALHRAFETWLGEVDPNEEGLFVIDADDQIVQAAPVSEAMQEFVAACQDWSADAATMQT